MDDTLGHERRWPLKYVSKQARYWSGRRDFAHEEDQRSTKSDSNVAAAGDELYLASTQVGWPIPPNFDSDSCEPNSVDRFIPPLY